MKRSFTDFLKTIFKRSSGGVDVFRFGETGGSARTISTASDAMTLPAVYRCVDILSGTIASYPLRLKRKEREGLYKTFLDDPLADIFAGMANSRLTFFDAMSTAVIHRLLYGNAYFVPTYKGGEVHELILLDPKSVVYDYIHGKYIVYDAISGIEGSYTPMEIIHLKNKSLDGGYTGVSTLEYASKTMSLSATADQQTMQGLKYGNTLSGFLTGGNVALGMGVTQDDYIDDVAKRITSEFNDGRRIMRLPSNADFKPLSISPADAQLLETRKYSPFDICRFFGVHPEMVFVSQSANYKSSANSQVTFYQQTLAPILKQISTEFTCKLIPRELRHVYRIEYDVTELNSPDLEGRVNYYKTCIESGVLTPNEVRAREGLDAVAGGDITFISCNVAPLTHPNVPTGIGNGVYGSVEKQAKNSDDNNQDEQGDDE